MKKTILLLIFLLISYNLFSQKKENFTIPDSLKKMRFDELQIRFNNHLNNDYQKHIYGLSYFKKSKLQKNTSIIFEGMCMASIISKNKIVSLQYLDSIISSSKVQPDFLFPAKAYILKSQHLLYDNHWNEALINLLKAKKYSEREKNIKQNNYIKQEIGLIKINLGKYEEALPLIRQNFDYIKLHKNISQDEISYSTFLLSDLYNRLGKIDSALFYSNNRLREITPQNRYYKYLIMSNGISYHLKKQYKASNILLDKAIASIYQSPDKLNLAISYYYRGNNILQGENNLQKAKIYFEKVDSIMVISKEYTPDIRNNYVNLIEISKKLNHDKKQLYYLNTLIEIDEILNKNNQIISKNVTQYYDTPHLLYEKEKIISQINNDIYILTACLIFTVLVFSSYNLLKMKREKKILDKQFYDLINDKENELKKLYLSDNKIKLTTALIEKNTSKLFDLPIAKDLVKKLENFENECGYLELNLKLVNLADRFDTNSSYLSKTINQYKGKNFSQYLNDLRINYAVIKLKKDKKIRKYTIKALAEEFGFNNSESFAKAFNSNTGLQPSYFIKKLNEEPAKI